MHDLNRIKDLLAQQEKLSAGYEELDALIQNLKTLRTEQKFIPDTVNASITDKLALLKTGQDSFLASYGELDELGDTPATITACKAELEDYEKYILEKAPFVDVINFVLSLESDNPSAKSALDEHKAFAAAYNCRANSVEQCKTDLKKYILLRKAFEEQDPTRRLSDIIELSPIIDFPLVVALNTNSLTIAGAETKTAPAAEAETQPEQPDSVRTVSEDISSSPVQLQAEPVVPEPEKTAAAESTEKEPLIDEPEYWQPIENQQNTSYSVPKQPVSDRPAPDEKPIFDQGIENGLNAELTQVLSRENAAASITASMPDVNAANAAAGDVWSRLGIYDKQAACYTLPDSTMKIFRCKRPKNFSVSDFQQEMSLKSANRFLKQQALKDIYRYGVTTIQRLAQLTSSEMEDVIAACDTLVNNGYLKAFRLSGPDFNNLEKIYVFTASGRKVFTNQETASLLNMKAVDRSVTPKFETHANAVLNRQLFMESGKLMERYMPSREYTVGSFILDPNSFINFFTSTKGEGTSAYITVLGDSPKDYDLFSVELKELLPSLNTITVIGLTKEHGQALTDWLYRRFQQEFSGKKLQYYSYDNDTYFSYPAGVPFRI